MIVCQGHRTSLKWEWYEMLICGYIHLELEILLQQFFFVTTIFIITQNIVHSVMEQKIWKGSDHQDNENYENRGR